MRRIIFSTILLLNIYCLAAQNITGMWKGRLVMEPGGCLPVYNIEFNLQITGNKISGNSYHYSDTSNYVKEEFEGTYDAATKTLNIEEKKISIFRIPPECTPCIKKYTLTYHVGDHNEEQLRGAWTGTMMNSKNSCPPGTIVMTRVFRSEFTPPPPPIANKKNVLAKEIFLDTGSVKIDFYDNGQIDGDTISVYLDNNRVVSNQLLSLKPITIYVKIDLVHPVQELVFVGENLGSIPPNTALMLVTTDEKRYQFYLSADDTKNSLVRFIYQPPKK